MKNKTTNSIPHTSMHVMTYLRLTVNWHIFQNRLLGHFSRNLQWSL